MLHCRMPSTLALQGDPACRLSTTSLCTTGPLLPPQQPNNIVISVDLLEELSKMSPKPSSRSQTSKTLFESLGVNPTKVGPGYSKILLQQKMSDENAAIKSKLQSKVYNKTQNWKREKIEAEVQCNNDKKVFCMTGSQKKLSRPALEFSPIHYIKCSTKENPTIFMTHRKIQFNLPESSADSYSVFTGSVHTRHKSSSCTSSEKRRKRLCDLQTKGRNISPGIETQTCKLFSKTFNEMSESSTHPINDECRDYCRDFHSVEAAKVIRIPTGRADARNQKNPGRLSPQKTAGAKKIRYPVPPRGIPAPEKFIQTWLEAGCESTKFSEKLRDDFKMSRPRSQVEEWALTVSAINRIKLLPNTLCSRQKLYAKET